MEQLFLQAVLSKMPSSSTEQLCRVIYRNGWAHCQSLGCYRPTFGTAKVLRRVLYQNYKPIDIRSVYQLHRLLAYLLYVAQMQMTKYLLY